VEDRDPLSGPAHEQKATIHRGETVVGGGGTLFDPTLTSDAALPDSQLGASSLQQLLGAWRSESWNDAQRLLAASTPAQRAAVARTIEVGAAGRARLIAALTSNLVIGPDAAKRDAHCKQQRSKLH
jgi:hypothetical protein